jgi:hypothetical protein
MREPRNRVVQVRRLAVPMSWRWSTLPCRRLEDARTFGIVDTVITQRDPFDEKIQKLMPVS